MRASDVTASSIPLLDHYLSNGGGLLLAGCGRDLVPPFAAAINNLPVNVFLAQHGLVIATAPARTDSSGFLNVRSLEVVVLFFFSFLARQLSRTRFIDVFEEFISFRNQDSGNQKKFQNLFDCVISACESIPPSLLSTLIGHHIDNAKADLVRDLCALFHHRPQELRFPVTGDDFETRIQCFLGHLSRVVARREGDSGV
jgi:hypothetical protein